MANGLAPKHLMPESSITWSAEEVMEWEIREALRFGVYTHPLDQSHLYCPFPLYEWQRDVLAASARIHSRAVLSTANESGKTSTLIPVFGFSLMCAFPGCQVYSTSGSERQVKEQLFEQQLRPYIEQRHMQEAGWRIKTGSELKVTAPNGSVWVGYVCSNELTAEGFHGYWREDPKSGEKRYHPCVYIVDEAKSVGDGVHEAIRRIDPDFWLTVSTPGKESGWFYEAIDPDSLRVGVGMDADEVKRKDAEWKKRLFLDGQAYGVNPLHDYQAEYENPDNTCMFTYRRMVDWNDCPHLHTSAKRLERQNIQRKYGENSAFVKSMLYGRFQRSEDFNLIYTDDDLELMKAAMRGDNRSRVIGKDVEAAGDISGGGDEQILMLRIGTEVAMQDSHQCRIDLDQADYWVKKLRALGIQPWQLTVDGGGLGATVANYMEQRLGYMGIKRAQANVGPKFKFEFRDKYTEVHFFLKELLSAGVLHMSKYDDVLLKQMRSRRFIEMEGGEKIKTEPKPAHRKREKSSPDRLDTLVYLFYDFDPYLLSTFTERAERVVEQTGLTDFEKEAAKKSIGGGERFAGMRDMGSIRKQFSDGMKNYCRKVGFGVGR